MDREELRTELEELERELRRLLPGILAGASRRVIEREFPEAVMALRDDAITSTLDYYVDLAPRLDYNPFPAEDETLPRRLATSARVAVVQPTDTASLLEGVGIRAIHDGSRETLIQNVRKERGKWARIPAYDACGFCRILGTRGPVYRSKHAALASHDGCGCEARIARPGMRLERPAYMRTWNDDYERHRDAVSASGRDALKAIANSWNRELYAQGIRVRGKHKHSHVEREAA
ncbi:capsid maturation protease [Mycobacterium phage NoShow]|nr:capsid maturation protease [Mycobacterium phage NoShow]